MSCWWAKCGTGIGWGVNSIFMAQYGNISCSKEIMCDVYGTMLNTSHDVDLFKKFSDLNHIRCITQVTNTHTQQQQLCQPIYFLFEDQNGERCSIFLPSYSSFHNQTFHSASHCNHLGNYSAPHHQCDYRFRHSDISNSYSSHSDSLQQSRKLAEGLNYASYFSRSFLEYFSTDRHTQLI
jgi:hypothetical protein